VVEQSRTWHHGLVAEWWAHFNTDGPEIEEYGHAVADGQPALDAGCGAGRLLVPWLRAGYDVDGCDVSEDMLDRCRERARREGLEPTLWATPLHELAAPRRYRTIVCCGTFGLGSTREQDEQALRRFREALEPGGTLILDHEVARPGQFEAKGEPPEPWPERGDRRHADDGSEYELRVRRVTVDPSDWLETMEMRAEKRDPAGRLVADETRELTMRSYPRGELRRLIERTGLRPQDERASASDSAIVVWVATA
jgi:SAM-dependent methyltransferase